MTKEDIKNLLTQAGVWFEWTDHPPVYTMEDIEALGLHRPGAEAKNLFVRDDKKRNFYLLTLPGNLRVDLKEFYRAHGLRKLSFASAEDLQEKLGLYAGAVSPMGLLNRQNHGVELYLHPQFENGQICLHPNDNTATVCMYTRDLVTLLENAGVTVHWSAV